MLVKLLLSQKETRKYLTKLKFCNTASSIKIHTFDIYLVYFFYIKRNLRTNDILFDRLTDG